ncbi:MAG: hypothetical protein P8X95_25695 [Anaerolineales bacterium]
MALTNAAARILFEPVQPIGKILATLRTTSQMLADRLAENFWINSNSQLLGIVFKDYETLITSKRFIGISVVRAHQQLP